MSDLPSSPPASIIACAAEAPWVCTAVADRTEAAAGYAASRSAELVAGTLGVAVTAAAASASPLG